MSNSTDKPLGKPLVFTAEQQDNPNDSFAAEIALTDMGNKIKFMAEATSSLMSGDFTPSPEAVAGFEQILSAIGNQALELSQQLIFREGAEHE